MAAEHVGFAERLVGDHQRQVERELHAGAGADRAHVLDAPAHLLEDGLGAREILGRAAGNAEQLAVAGRPDGAADRALDEGRALGAHLVGERDLHLRLHGAHLDEELALGVAGEQTRGALVHGGDGRAIGEDGDDGFHQAHELGGACGHLGAGLRQGLDLVGRPVPDGDLVADLHEPGGDCRPHAAQTRNANVHPPAPPDHPVMAVGRSITQEACPVQCLA